MFSTLTLLSSIFGAVWAILFVYFGAFNTFPVAMAGQYAKWKWCVRGYRYLVGLVVCSIIYAANGGKI